MMSHPEVVIIGGGPAGSTAATVLADHGHSVLVLEKAAFPRHHIGESLMPHTYWTFRRIGMLDKLRGSGFTVKESVQFINASGRESQPFFFPDYDPGEHSYTWQVARPQFDKLMLDNAREHGAEVCEGALVRQVLFEGERAVGVSAVIDGAPVEIPARVVIDASGQNALLSRQLKLRYGDDRLKNVAIYAYYRGAIRDPGRNAGATLVIATAEEGGWFWSIPLADDITSVGVVAPPSYLCAGRGDDPLATLDEEIALCPGIARRLAGAERVSHGFVTSDFSYRSRRAAGDGWVLIGDAFGFLDPIYSSGVMLALKSGELAADAVHQALVSGDLSARRLESFGPQIAAGMQHIRALVYAYYNREFSFGRFIREHPEYHDHVVRILIGDVFNDDVPKVFEAMRRWIALPEPIELETAS